MWKDNMITIMFETYVDSDHGDEDDNCGGDNYGDDGRGEWVTDILYWTKQQNIVMINNHNSNIVMLIWYCKYTICAYVYVL